MLEAFQAVSLGEIVPNREAMTLCVRQSATTPDGADTFTAYNLYAVKRVRQGKSQDNSGGVSVSVENCTFQLYNSDLVQANLPGLALYPSPYLAYQLVDQRWGQTQGNTTSGSTVVTGLATTAGLMPGMGVVGGSVAPGSTIQAVGSGQITLSLPCTGTFTGAVVTIGDAWEITKADRHKTYARWDCECVKAR